MWLDGNHWSMLRLQWGHCSQAHLRPEVVMTTCVCCSLTNTTVDRGCTCAAHGHGCWLHEAVLISFALNRGFGSGVVNVCCLLNKKGSVKKVRSAADTSISITATTCSPQPHPPWRSSRADAVVTMLYCHWTHEYHWSLFYNMLRHTLFCHCVVYLTVWLTCSTDWGWASKKKTFWTHSCLYFVDVDAWNQSQHNRGVSGMYFCLLLLTFPTDLFMWNL